jgi:predicted small lipoprotein YifL
MRDAITMCKSVLVLVMLGLCACGQQSPLPQPRAADDAGKTHAAATSIKGQIIQPVIKPGKAADASSLLISFHGCADLLLTDPHGHKIGYDPASKKSYLEIAGGIYDEGDPIGDDEDDVKRQGQEKPVGKQPDCMADKTVQFPNPVPGTYLLKIGNNRAAAFKLEITSYGVDAKANGHYIVSQAAGSAPLSYQFALPPTLSAEIQVKAISK